MATIEAVKEAARARGLRGLTIALCVGYAFLGRMPRWRFELLDIATLDLYCNGLLTEDGTPDLDALLAEGTADG